MQRRQQGAAFTPDAMDAYLPRVVATCEAYLQRWASQDSVNLVPAVRLPSLEEAHLAGYALRMAPSYMCKSATGGRRQPSALHWGSWSPQ